MKSALATAFVAFVTAVSLLSYHYKTEWAAPNFVTHSSTFDWIYARISDNLHVKYSYSDSHQPVPIVSSDLVDLTSDGQLVQERESSLYHLLHVPAWALVPDRITKHQGSMESLYNAFDATSKRWKDTLTIASDNIDVSPTKSLMRSHMESLSKSEKYWIKNISAELFNCSQLIFSYQMLNYADEIERWIQNSEHSNNDLRFHFERTRGWPLLYTPFNLNKIKTYVFESKLSDNSNKNLHHDDDVFAANRQIDSNYFDICNNIIDSMERELEDSNDNSDVNQVPTLKECEVMLDLLLPWLPDRPQTLSAMWPFFENILLNLDELNGIIGVNSSFTQVIKQNHRPSSDVPLHYVSVDGKERIRVEWFINELHYRATNIAFVRRIRIHVKRMTSALRISIGKEDPPDADDWEAFFAQYDPDYEPHIDPRTQQLDDYFVDFLDYFCNETEKGEFDKVLRSDLSQDMNLFFHALPSVAVFRDGQLKRAWNMIIGVWDKHILDSDSGSRKKGSNTVEKLDFTSRASGAPRNKRKFLYFYGLLSNDNLGITESNLAHAAEISLEIVPVWPYTVGGWLRAMTPELAFYSYPNEHDDCIKVGGIKRSVVLLDVIVTIYSNNMRSIADNKFYNRNDAKLITLQSVLQYVYNMLTIQHNYFYNRYITEDNIMFPFDSSLNENQGVFVRLGALIACNDVNEESDNGSDGDRDVEACLLSGVMYNVIDGFVRENEYAQHLLLFLDKYSIFEFSDIDEESGKKLANPKLKFNFDKLLNENEWKTWKNEYFEVSNDNTNGLSEFETMLQHYYLWKYNKVGSDTRTRKSKRKRLDDERNIIDDLFSLVRNIPKYSVVARPGEDSFQLSK